MDLQEGSAFVVIEGPETILAMLNQVATEEQYKVITINVCVDMGMQRLIILPRMYYQTEDVYLLTGVEIGSTVEVQLLLCLQPPFSQKVSPLLTVHGRAKLTKSEQAPFSQLG